MSFLDGFSLSPTVELSRRTMTSGRRTEALFRSGSNFPVAGANRMCFLDGLRLSEGIQFISATRDLYGRPLQVRCHHGGKRLESMDSHDLSGTDPASFNHLRLAAADRKWCYRGGACFLDESPLFRAYPVDSNHLSPWREQTGSNFPRLSLVWRTCFSSDCECPRVAQSISAVGHQEGWSERPATSCLLPPHCKTFGID